MRSKQTFERDNLIVQILKNHVGKDNAIKSKEISEILFKNGYELKHTGLRNYIEKIRKERRLPIWHNDKLGFYWFSTQQEVKEAILKVNSIIDTLQKTVELLKFFETEMFEQKIFELENHLKECENGYAETLFLNNCKLHDAEKKVKELTKEIEGLKHELKSCSTYSNRCQKS